MKPSLPFTKEILNSTMWMVYMAPQYAKPFDIITFFEIKTIFGQHINQLESVFLGTFGKSFSLKKEDEGLFTKLYPYLSTKLHEAYGNNWIFTISRALETFRNFNMHARSYKYLDSLNALVPLVKLLPNYSTEIRYFDKDQLTFAGMTVVLLLLSNQLMIDYMLKNYMWQGFLENIRLTGPNMTQYENFANEIVNFSKNNFEMDIRTEKDNKTIYDTIFGRFSGKVKREGENFTYINGRDEDHSEYFCSGRIIERANEIVIHINRGSYYPEYFKDDYHLTIKDRETFNRFANSLPPFTFITFLYHAKIDVFNHDSISKNTEELIIKLNHPRYYVDKNINTILIPVTIADLRVCSQIVASGLNYCFIKFENETYSKFHIECKDYSTLREALIPYGIDSRLVGQVISVRNFFAHHHILGDNIQYGKGQFNKIDLDFIFDVMNRLITQLNKRDKIYATYFRKNFFYKIIMNLVYVKYYDSYESTKELLETEDLPLLINTMQKSALRMSSSCFTEKLENMIPLFIDNDDVSFNYNGDNGKKRFKNVFKTTIVSDTDITLVNGKNTCLKNFTVYHFDEPDLSKLFKYSECNKIDEKEGGLLKERKYRIKNI